MARVQTPPEQLDFRPQQLSVFLAGSIDMGQAEPWQSRFIERFAHQDVHVLNPRRADWDASWTQSVDNEPFRTQVEWELEALERSDIIAMYFAPTSQAPVTMLEFGLFARSDRLIVCCANDFWRKGNIDVVCRRYQIEQVESFDALLEATMNRMQALLSGVRSARIG